MREPLTDLRDRLDKRLRDDRSKYLYIERGDLTRMLAALDENAEDITVDQMEIDLA